MKYQPYTLKNFREIPQLKKLPDEQIRAIEVVGSVLPFKTNNYVVENLIDWGKVPHDPMFILNFPQKDMLLPEDYCRIDRLRSDGASPEAVSLAANEIRMKLNPHPRGDCSTMYQRGAASGWTACSTNTAKR